MVNRDRLKEEANRVILTSKGLTDHPNKVVDNRKEINNPSKVASNRGQGHSRLMDRNNQGSQIQTSNKVGHSKIIIRSNPNPNSRVETNLRGQDHHSSREVIINKEVQDRHS